MKYIIANHKMNHNELMVKNWIYDFDLGVKKINILSDIIKIIIAPSYIHIPFFTELSKKYPFIKICSQDFSQNLKGTYTGKVSVLQIKDFCEYSIIGHSETLDDIDLKIAKIKLALEHKISPIICTKDPVLDYKFIDNLINFNNNSSIIAFEDPVNISKDGVYNQKPIEQIRQAVQVIKQKYNKNNIVYGGSVNEKNILDISDINELSGVLVGNASLNPQSFLEIIKVYNNLKW